MTVDHCDTVADHTVIIQYNVLYVQYILYFTDKRHKKSSLEFTGQLIGTFTCMCGSNVLAHNVAGTKVTTECEHVFCKECIETQLKNNNSCPNCRTIITKLYNNNVS